MSRIERNIEDLFRTLFEQFKVNPTQGLWKQIQARITWNQFLSFSLNSFNVYYLAAAITLAGAGAYFMLPSTGSQMISEAAGFISAENVVTLAEPATDQDFVREHPPTGEQAPVEKVEATTVKVADTQSSSRTATEQKKSEPEFDPQKNNAVQQKETETAATPPEQSASAGGETISVPETIKVKVEFQANPMSGCTPLAVNFQSLSENADGINWTFGDGGNSHEPNPSYVFDEPGDFVVTLKIMGKDGGEYSRQQTIQVFETPKALFEFDEDIKLTKNQPVYFYNYSRGADYFEWDFGDKQRSDLLEPIHYYDKAGSYHVKLKVWTDKQCYDSMMIYNAFGSQEQNIKVPNAFTPNLNGPTGGYYDVNAYDNTVFHPVINGELLEYQLKVFNRKGVLLFESKDISIGWDGYYNEQLLKQDVYIWKLRGKFNNGKPFVESGDITLIKQY